MDFNCSAVECEFEKLEDFWRFFQFPGIDFSSYIFLNVDYDVYSHGAQIYVPPVFNSTYLNQVIQQEFVAEHMILHLYPASLSLEQVAEQMASIDKFQDYIQSDCQMIVLVYDCLYVEVYCKDHTWLHRIIEHVRSFPDTKVTPKSLATDTRTTMNV